MTVDRQHALCDLGVPDGRVAVRWFGQNSLAIKDAAGTIVQIDPYFPRHRPAEEFVHTDTPLDETTLPTDYVLVTHNHRDHCCTESHHRILTANPETRFIAPPEAADSMVTGGIAEDRILRITAGDEFGLGSMTGHALYAKPPGGSPRFGIPAPDTTHLGFVIEAGELRLYVSGDTVNCLAEEPALMDPVAALRPAIGLLTTHPTEGEFPFFEGAAAVARALRLETVIPVHNECFVKRRYDASDFCTLFDRPGDPRPVVIPYNTHMIFPESP
jgi:L-ascorbate metabolism protein UlaG (beta-lactamase superfamily)